MRTFLRHVSSLALLAAVLSCPVSGGQPGLPTAPAQPQSKAPVRQILRVGTTEDYRPYSYIDPHTGQVSGIDIELAKDLAQFLRLKVQFVKTTWTGLQQDYQADQFDIAMSGISRTAERERWAAFSRGYQVDGKTPIARCDRKKSFNTPEKINQPTVRLIVNPGGTNQKFVVKKFGHAQVVVYPDNATIFEQLIARKADVMVTDAVEVALQTSLHPELCATMPGTQWEPTEKAILLGRDEELKKQIDIWLREIEHSGKLAGLMMKYTSP